MNQFLSTSEAAHLLGISRIAVFQKIKAGHLPAQKVGRNYIINRDDLNLPSETLSNNSKEFINKSVDKVIDDYGETLKLLKDA